MKIILITAKGRSEISNVLRMKFDAGLMALHLEFKDGAVAIVEVPGERPYSIELSPE